MTAGKQVSIAMVHGGMALQSSRRLREGLFALAASFFAPSAGVRSRLREARDSLEAAAARLSAEPAAQQEEPACADDA
jgi:hypothetical protein